MRVLAITSELPWPLDSGGRLRTFHVLKALAAVHDLRLVVPVQESQQQHLATLQTQGITVVPAIVPVRSRLAEAKRLLAARLSGEPYVMYRRHARPEVFAAVQRERQAKPDAVWLDHIDSLLFKPQGVKSVIDLHNVYSLILNRLATESTNPIKRTFLRGEAKRLAAIERKAAECDTLVTVSNTEAEHFRKLGAKRVIVAPNGVDCAAFSTMPVGRANSRPIILFLGTLSWGPNVTASVRLAREIFPEVRTKIPAAELHLVGRDPSKEVLSLAGNGVSVMGSVPSITPYLEQSSLLAVPLDSGGGTRLKILEAFAAGLPVVSTNVGAEGIDARDGVHIAIAECDLMSNRIIDILNNPAPGVRMATAARQLANDVYDWKRIGEICVCALA